MLAELDNFSYYGEEIYGITQVNENVFVLKDSVSLENRISAFEIFMEHVNQYEKALYIHKDWSKISQLIDVTSFVKIFLLQEFSEDSDSCRTSLYFYKDGVDDMLHLGPPWDYDIAFGVFQTKQRGGDPEMDYIDHISEYMEFSSNFFSRLLDYPVFRRLVANYYQFEMKRMLENIERTIDAYYQEICESAEINYKRWNVLGNDTPFEGGRTIGETYEEEIEFLKEWIAKRIMHMTQKYNNSFVMEQRKHEEILSLEY